MALAHWKTGLKEQYRSWVKRSFVRSLQTLVPEIEDGDLGEPGAGVRAQAVARNGGLVQDFSIVATERSIHVLNAPSPAATACLAIGNHIVQLAQRSFGLKS
jgi:L-2-hydroxyglutarate oxidase